MEVLNDTIFISKPLDTDELENGTAAWQSPSNIALVKYWGKSEPQLPANPSVSFTLSKCHTRTKLIYKRALAPSHTPVFRVFFEGREEQAFRPKIEKFLERIDAYVPFLKEFELEIHTENSFPHSSGIASSASGMSALALCIMSLERRLDPAMSGSHFLQKASFLARLGSGSAARSLQGPLVVWGRHLDIENSSDLYGTPYPYSVHTDFKDYQDTILLVDKGVKQVSSTLGHGLMHGHPFAPARFLQAEGHLTELIPALRDGDLESFIRIVESEALSLHAMMMTSDPYFLLMRPNTLRIIEKIWAFRKETGTPVCFTLDAGANVHVLFPFRHKEKTEAFIHNELAEHCQNGQYISDETGPGAIEL